MDTAAEKLPMTQRITPQMLVVTLMLVGFAGFVGWMLFQPDIRKVSGGYLQVDLKAMSTFPFDQTNGTMDDVPAKWRELNGKKVILYGEMWQPQAAAGKLSNFELVYSIANCCFSGPPQIQHFIHSKVAPGKTVNYYNGLVKVTGTLHVNVKKAGGQVVSVYQLDVEDVEQG